MAIFVRRSSARVPSANVSSSDATDGDVAKFALQLQSEVGPGRQFISASLWPIGQRHADLARPLRDPLPPPPSGAQRRAVSRDSLTAVRAAARELAAGCSDRQAADFALAVDEVATNSVIHGGGHGELCMWSEGEEIVCEITAAGANLDPLAGRRRPDPRVRGGRGLWIADQLCDLVQLRSLDAGNLVRLRMTRR